MSHDRNQCHDCHHPIPNGTAIRRSIAFTQVAFHAACWKARTGRTLSERLAEVAGEGVTAAELYANAGVVSVRSEKVAG